MGFGKSWKEKIYIRFFHKYVSVYPCTPAAVISLQKSGVGK